MMSSNRRRREAIISDKRQRPKATASRVKTRESEAAHSDSETTQRRTLRSWACHEEECERKERPPRPLWKPSETTQPNVIEPTQTDSTTERSDSKVGSQTTGVQTTTSSEYPEVSIKSLIVSTDSNNCGYLFFCILWRRSLCYITHHHPVVFLILLYL